MTQDDFFTTVEELKRARGPVVEYQGRALPASVALLEQKLAREGEVSRRQMLYSIYYLECTDLDRRDLELDARRKEIEEFPMEPVPLVGLAMALAADREDLEDAARNAALAVEAAVHKGEFINYSLLAQVRISLMTRSYGTLESALRSLIEFGRMSPRADCALETDFLKDIPPGAIDPTIIAAYESMTSREASR
jgi:hypothetical protein